jgi:hypothetical protein
MKALLLLTTCFALTACDGQGPIIPKDLRIPPELAMQECPQIASFALDKDTTVEDVINKLAEVGAQYKGCARIHKQLIDYELGNKTK